MVFEAIQDRYFAMKRIHSAQVGVRSILINPSVGLCVCVRLSANISLEPLDRSSRNFVCKSVAVAHSPSGGVALHYILPVLRMTSRLAIMGGMALRGRPDLL